ncbi:MAG: 4-hydroxythreonine-4-phosphate dehydrogenase PdxA [Pseudomonadota bacterium]
MHPQSPVLITCGEPAGIGPEIAAKAWAALSEEIRLVWIGDPTHLGTQVPINIVSHPGEALHAGPDRLAVLAHDFGAPRMAGIPQRQHAPHVIKVIEEGVNLVKTGKACALCTAPIHKKALIDGAGFPYPGHTEYLAALAENADVVMMLVSDHLRVVPATIHIALEEVTQKLTPARLRRTIEITAAGLKSDFGISAPRLAIAGLNPHAGEGGSMGRQERDWMQALITEMIAEGFDLQGPLPADSMFHARARKNYDAAIAMYHDQALIPIKTLDFDRGVNVTLGLPFIRTSPDHGTAFDIAGKDIADPTSMIHAIKRAYAMAQNRR